MAEAGSVLVTGGAGYIGSHVTRLLAEAGRRVVVYDDLSSGHAWAVLGAELVVGDLARPRAPGRPARRAAVRRRAPLRGATSGSGNRSATPARYYRNNIANALGLFELVRSSTASRHVVFSSTAAVYGAPEGVLVDERAPLAPINPYGASKAMTERMLTDIARGHGPALRDPALLQRRRRRPPTARIGEATPDNRI